MARSRLTSQLCLGLLLLVVTYHSHAFGVLLYGVGSPNAVSVLSKWTPSYLFTRDDVSVSYDGVGVTPAFATYSQGDADFLMMDRGLSAELSAEYGGLAQLPLAGQAIVMAYNITALSSTDPNIVVDRETLGLIWAGNVSHWNDQRLKDLNPAIASKLPNASILIGYNENGVISLPEVLKLAFESFSANFKAALAAGNRTWAGLPPAQRGTAEAAGGSTPARLQWLAANDNSMTFLNYADTVSSQFKWMDMINKAGKLVRPSVASVQSAMDNFSDKFAQSNFSIDIIDADGNDSWPISYMSYLSMQQNLTTYDCTNIFELLSFVAWVQTNDAASQEAIKINVAPLDISLRERLINLISTVECNGATAYTTSYLVGVGSPLPLMTSWGVAWSAQLTKMKYYDGTSYVAKQQLSTNDVDFGLVSDGLSAEWHSVMSDAALTPITAYALVPGYYVPELAGLELVLDFDTIARIYLNEITMWDDERIKALNSDAVVAALPSQPIIVITQSIAAGTTSTFTAVLTATVPDFAAQVGAGPLVTFPVQSASGNRSIVVSTTDVITPLRTTKYSFAFWSNYDVQQARTVSAAAMKNAAGNVVSPNSASVLSALRDYEASGQVTFDSLTLGTGAGSWPVASFASIIYHESTMTDCPEAEALADFLYWSQTSTIAAQVADRHVPHQIWPIGMQGFVRVTQEGAFKGRFLNQLKAFTCLGERVSQVANCVSDGQLCSGAGVCTSNQCLCTSGRDGQYCENVISSSSDNTLAIALGVALPSVGLALALLVCLVLVLVAVIKRKGDKSDDWEIEYDELEIGEQLGAGGYGEVSKAMWKGTEVAVKVMASDKITKDMEKSFKDEVRVMTALRHPNVVLFMAASTKAPKMCIVMEYMALGSLFDLLHNELIPEIPFQLKAKMAYQASKGMHFLHSSGIVHRDLKSLNLLLDAKWNAKVSDFGLTKFKEDVNAKGAGKDIAGSVHWTAPEVLNESLDVDYILADVYSFGIILWELLTREQPYFGLSPAAVAVAVIRDGIRPTMPAAEESLMYPAEYEELITSCWHTDPTIRPTFLEIMTRLSAMHDDSTSAGATSTSHTSSSSGHSGGTGGAKKGHGPSSMYGSWTLPSSTNSTGSSSSSSNSSASQGALAAGAAGGIRPPEGEVAIVFTDITRAASLWEFNAAAMRDATLLHNETLRSALKKHRGYEVVFIRDRNSGEGSFCMAFQQASDALAWCSEVQQALLAVEWPEALLEHPGAAEEWGDTDDRVLYKGLRVRMGVHLGTPRTVRDPMTRRVEYIGPVVNAAARITAMTHGGQIVLSHTVHNKIKESADPQQQEEDGQSKPRRTLVSLGKFEIPDTPQGARLYELKVDGLEGRFFGGVTRDSDNTSSDHHTKSKSGKSTEEPMSGASTGSSDGGGREVQTAVGEGMMFKEDTFLTSANLCRWIIDFGEIQVGKQVGLGSYGVVFRGKWKGVEVAVKRFIKQKLDERRMLEFRAEMAFLSELHHPNIVLFIGACVKKPNLCIVTEFMKQGSLKDILANNTIKLAWKQKMRMLRSAALGINYLHSLHPVIVHRDLKPSNLLVDENMNVKVADFGFARIKEENATMTRCGTPCWTAPEILRGEKYDERADVFSFGIVMWQVVTRREPYAGRNFMGVSLDVLEGKRPQIPNDCQVEFKKMMKKCWHANADKRPTMEAVVAFLDQQVGDDQDAALGL